MKRYNSGFRDMIDFTFIKNMKEVFKRFIDREREFMSLRNMVGMMSEARQSDTIEYEQMRDLYRSMRDDALRFRFITEDHQDSVLRSIIQGILVNMINKSLADARLEIDVVADEYGLKKW